MIDKTEAIVLRVFPYSNTSCFVSWLTPEMGRISTILKGAYRPRSIFLGQYDLFYTCELVIYARERSGAHIARECSPIKTRNNLRSDWRAAATASYFSDLISRTSPLQAPHAGLYELLDSALDHLAAGGSNIPMLFWFELKLLATLGLAPRLDRCLSCGKNFSQEGRKALFSYGRGGILCSNCSSNEDNSMRIAPDVLAMLNAWQKARNPRSALSTQCTTRQTDEAERFLGLFLSYHLDAAFPSRAVALDTLRRGIPNQLVRS